MGWNLEIKTTAGDHYLYFESKDQAEAALAEVEQCIGMAPSQTAKIADQLVVLGHQVTSGKIYET